MPAPTVPFEIQSAARTHQGAVRRQNQDSYFARPDAGLWAVADGMGGHEGGEWASAKLVEKFEAIGEFGGLDEAAEAVADAIRKANRSILREGERRGKQMGTTIVSLLVRGRNYRVIWVGDSRAYLLRGGKLRQLSRDHTQVQEMVSRGILQPADAVDHPMGHVLSRAIGVREEVEMDSVEGELQPGDTFLLCSDGLHGYVEEEEISRLLARGSPERATEELVERTLAAGAPDNVTVIAIWASEPTLLSLPDR